MTKPTFSIRDLLIVTLWMAVACFALMTPSQVWFYPIPFVICVCSVIVARQIALSLRIRHVFLFSVLAGILTYFVADLGLRGALYLYPKWGLKAYQLLHGLRSQKDVEKLNAFIVSLHFAVAHDFRTAAGAG